MSDDPLDDRPRIGDPERFSIGASLGIDEAMIERLVHAFYTKVRADAELGPIFNGVIAEDAWRLHLERMCQFWSSVTLTSGRYKGQPVPAHVKHDSVRVENFGRWLALFRETAHEVAPEKAAALFIERAERIAESLQLAIRMHRGESVVPLAGRAL